MRFYGLGFIETISRRALPEEFGTGARCGSVGATKLWRGQQRNEHKHRKRKREGDSAANAVRRKRTRDRIQDRGGNRDEERKSGTNPSELAKPHGRFRKIKAAITQRPSLSHTQILARGGRGAAGIRRNTASGRGGS